MKTAFVTAIGSVSGDIVIKSLKRMGMRVIGCDIYPKEWVADAYNVDVFYRAPYVSDVEKYLEFVHDVCKNEKVNFVLPLIDLEVDLLNKNREWFEENNICLCISPERTLDICRNKKVLADYIDTNCPDIKTIPTTRLQDVRECPFAFPVVCKPINGRSSQGLRYIYNEAEWDLFVQTANKDNYIVQPFISGPIVLVEIVRNPVTNHTVAIPRQELLRTPHGCATTVLMYHDINLENNAIKLANTLGVVGSVNFEFIRDKHDAYHFIECNPRFSAGTEFSCLGGYEVVINHLRCFENKEIDPFTFKKKMIIARKYEEYVTSIDYD